MMIRTLIVDDEELARRGIQTRLDRRADIEIVAEAENGRQAVAAVRELDPDLVFLDIGMPGMDGFGVVEAIGVDAVPVLIFVTAYDRHALEAFEVHALDYLLKPIDDDRFEEAVDRAVERIRRGRASGIEERLEKLLAGMSAPPENTGRDRFVVRQRGRVEIVPAEQILWVEAAGDYVALHTADGTHLMRETMAAMESHLDPARFIRVHRSAIVHGDRVRRIESDESGGCVVVLHDGHRVRASRTYRERLERFLGESL